MSDVVNKVLGEVIAAGPEAITDVVGAVTAAEQIAAGPGLHERIAGVENLLSRVLGFLAHLFPGHDVPK